MEILYETATGRVLEFASDLTSYWMRNGNSVEAYNELLSSGKARMLTVNPTAEERELIDAGEAVIVRSGIQRDPSLSESRDTRAAAETVARLWPAVDRLAIEQALLDRAKQAVIRSVI